MQMHDRIEIFYADRIGQRQRTRRSGVAEQTIQAPKRLHSQIYRGVDVLLVCHIAADISHRLAVFFHQPRSFVVLDVGSDNFGAFPHKQVDRRPANARRRACNHSNFSAKAPCHFVPHC